MSSSLTAEKSENIVDFGFDERLRVNEIGPLLLGQENHFKDFLHPNPYPGSYLWSDIMLYECVSPFSSVVVVLVDPRSRTQAQASCSSHWPNPQVASRSLQCCTVPVFSAVSSYILDTPSSPQDRLPASRTHWPTPTYRRRSCFRSLASCVRTP
jgi:hypothetical protein